MADRDATEFAAEFHKVLTGLHDVVAAAARARLRLHSEHAQEPRFGRHWHIARVCLGPRRAIQQVLGAFQDGEEPRPDRPTVAVQPARRAMLAAVLKAFGRQGRSKLLLTSRYTFSLPDSRGRDLAGDLVLVPLRAMDDTDRRKQQRALLRELPVRQIERLDQALLQRATELADGNPGLQALLSQPVLALSRRMAFHTYRDALRSQQLRALQSGCLFASGLPVPLEALHAAASSAGVGDAGAAVLRLHGLGLLDDHGELAEIAHAAVNPVTRPLFDAIPEDDARRWAGAALPALESA